jgi:hypothetical protein
MHQLKGTLNVTGMCPLKSHITRTATAPIRIVESSPQHTSWFHLFTYKRFHVLLNSLFKVLCNFPSRYLFAIGLAVIFSLRWSLPPALCCTLKQHDSSMQQFAYSSLVTAMGLAPALEKALVRGTCVTQAKYDALLH